MMLYIYGLNRTQCTSVLALQTLWLQETILHLFDQCCSHIKFFPAWQKNLNRSNTWNCLSSYIALEISHVHLVLVRVRQLWIHFSQKMSHALQFGGFDGTAWKPWWKNSLRTFANVISYIRDSTASWTAFIMHLTVFEILFVYLWSC